MKAAHLYHQVPHKPNCDCTGCELIRLVQADAYAVGHQEGFYKGKESRPVDSWSGVSMDTSGGAFRPDEIENANRW